MKRFHTTIAILICLLISTALIVGCSQEQGSEHDVVESGTYTGQITEVKPDEDEIYLESNGKELELYFIEETKLTRNGESVPFTALETGQKVKVEVEKVGKRLDPLSVKILE